MYLLIYIEWQQLCLHLAIEKSIVMKRRSVEKANDITMIICMLLRARYPSCP